MSSPINEPRPQETPAHRMHTPSLIATVAVFIVIAGATLYASSREERLNMEAAENAWGASEPLEEAELANIQTENSEGDLLLDEEYVSFTDSGFSPTVVRVRTGGTVTFTNNSSEELLLSPSTMLEGDVFTGFEEADPIPPGESITLRFEETGIWGYARRDHSGMVGIVVAEE